MPYLFSEDAKQYFGISEVYDIEKISEILPSLIPDSSHIYSYTSADARIHSQVQSAFKSIDEQKLKYYLH